MLTFWGEGRELPPPILSNINLIILYGRVCFTRTIMSVWQRYNKKFELTKFLSKCECLFINRSSAVKRFWWQSAGLFVFMLAYWDVSSYGRKWANWNIIEVFRSCKCNNYSFWWCVFANVIVYWACWKKTAMWHFFNRLSHRNFLVFLWLCWFVNHKNRKVDRAVNAVLRKMG